MTIRGLQLPKYKIKMTIAHCTVGSAANKYLSYGSVPMAVFLKTRMHKW